MIEKLMIEANEEADGKAFCDEETAKARKSQAADDHKKQLKPGGTPTQ